MGKVRCEFSMSLDGFIAGPNEEFAQLFKWYESGDTEFIFEHGMKMQVSATSARVLTERVKSGGAFIMARRMFDLVNGWNDAPPIDAPIFVMTHHPETIPDTFTQPESRYTVVSDGLESAIDQARAVAGDKAVALYSTSLVQQALQAGLLDEIHIDLVPFILGDGIPLFKHLAVEPIALELSDLVVAENVTHLVYNVKHP